MRRVPVERIASEDVVNLSEDVAVSRFSDAKNTGWLRGLIALLAFIVIAQCIVAGATSRILPWRRTIPFVNLLLILVAFGVLDELVSAKRRFTRLFRGAAALVGRNVRAWALAFIAAEYLLLMLFATEGGWVAIYFLAAAAMLGLRLLPVEVLLMHGLFVVTAAVEGVIVAKKGSAVLAVLIVGLFFHLGAIGYGLLATRRFRTRFLARFRDERSDALERQRMRDELRFAREVQLSMLPEAAPSLGWIDIAATSLPATEVGGDYYDFFILDEDRIAIVSGDVAGHGLACGLVLAALRSGFTLLRDQLGEPARVLRRLHDLVMETSRRRMLVTAAIVLLDRAARRAVITSAGHPPLIVKRHGGSAETIELFAPPLGVRLPIQTPERALAFSAGDAFVVHSDGIYETLNEGGETYGIECIVAVLEAQPAAATAAELRDAILADVERFRGGVPQADDITLVVARLSS